MLKLLLMAILVNISFQDPHVSRSFDGLESPPEVQKGNQIVFVNEGELANQIGFVHVRIIFPLGDTKRSIENAKTNLGRSIREEKDLIRNESLSSIDTDERAIGLANNKKAASKTYLFVMNAINTRISDFYNRFLDLLTGLPNSQEENLASQNLYHVRDRQHRSITMAEEDELDREERAIGVAVAGAIAMGGTILGGMSLSQIRELNEKFGRMEFKHNNLVDLVDAQKDAMKDLQLDMKVVTEIQRFINSRDSAILLTMSDRAVDHITDVKERIEAIVEAAQYQRLSPKAISGKTLIRLWTHLKEKAIKDGYDLMLEHPSDIYQLEASYIYDPVKMEFIMFIHVPMLPSENKFTLYRFAPFPMIHPIDKNVTKIIEVGEETYLAVNAKKEYRIMSTIDVNACNRRGKVFFCLERNAVYRDLEETCLGALYQKKAEKVVEHCRFQTKVPTEFVLPSGDRKWLIYSPESQLVNVECSKRREAPSPVTIKGQVLVRLLEGCTMKMERSVISSDDNFYRDMTIFHGVIEDDLFRGTDASSLAVQIAELGIKLSNYTGPENLDHLKSFEFQTYFSKSNSVLYAFVGIILIALACVFIFFCLKFRRESRHRKNLHLENHSRERDWSDKFANLLFDSARKRNTETRPEVVASAPENFSALPPRYNSIMGKEICFSDNYVEERSHLCNDAPNFPFRSATPEFSKKSQKSKTIDPKKDKLSKEKIDSEMRRRFILQKNDMSTIPSAIRKKDPKNGNAYPCLDDDEKPKNCGLSERIISMHKGLEFLCTQHNPKKGCTGVFLSNEALISAKSLVTENYILNE